MAIEFVDVQIGDRTKKAFVVENVEGVDQVILRETLMNVDVDFLKYVDEEGEGVDFAEKLKTTKLRNGINAEKFFASRVFGVDELTIAARRGAVKRDLVGAVIALQDTNTAPDGGDGGDGGGV